MGQRPRGFAVIDVETTGLRTDWHNRVIEIGVVLLDRSGEVSGEWCSLVNPGRDLGPQRIHRISAADIRHAPTFADLAGTLAGLLRGRVVAAHNLAFDLRFIAYEFSRLGVSVPLALDAGVCTMERAPEFLPYAPRNLAGCCALADVPLVGHHDALVDAHAAAGLLRHYIRSAPGALLWEGLYAQAALLAGSWPDIPNPDPARTAAAMPDTPEAAEPDTPPTTSPAAPPETFRPATARSETELAGVVRGEDGGVEGAAVVVRRGVSAERDGHFLARMLDRLPRAGSPTGADAYLDLLDRALLDHHISPTEGDELIGLATDLGLSRADVRTLHRDYLAALARAALSETLPTPDSVPDSPSTDTAPPPGDPTSADPRTDEPPTTGALAAGNEGVGGGVVGVDVWRELELVARLLGEPVSAVDEVLAKARSAPSLPRPRPAPGDLIAFTGEVGKDAEAERDAMAERARAAGFVPHPYVTKQVRLLVAADPDTLSGKARRARAYGIPIITIEAFDRLLARSPDLP